MSNSQFEDKIRRRIIEPAQQQICSPTYGLVLSFDAIENTASVLLANPGTDDHGEIYNNVPCPTQVGLQTVAPEPGRPCWVVWKDNTNVYPIITHYFNHVHARIDYMRQTQARNDVPRYFLNM